MSYSPLKEPAPTGYVFGRNSTAEDPDVPPVGEDGMLLDSIKGIGRGVEGFAKSLWSLADVATGDRLYNWQDDESIFGKSSTTAGQIVEGITQFATAFIPFAGAAGKVGTALSWTSKAAKLAQGAIAGGAADFFAFRGHEERLSNLLVQVPGLRNGVTEFLAADKDDGEVEGRLKNVIEGLALGAIGETLFGGIRAIKAGRKASEAGLDDETVRLMMQEKFGITDEEQVVKGIEAFNTGGLNAVKELSAREAKVHGQRQAAEALAGSLLDLENGRLNLKTVLSKAEFDSQDELYQLVDSATDHFLKVAGDGGKVEGVVAKYGNAAAQLKLAEQWTDNSDALLALMRGTKTDAVTVGVRAALIENLLRETYDDLLTKVKVANATGDIKDVARAMKIMERAQTLHVGNAAVATAQSHAFTARKFTKVDESMTLSQIKAAVRQRGGNKYLKAYFKRIGMADSAEALSKAVSTGNGGNRFWRVHNEYLINSMLSGVKTQVVNAFGSVATSIYLPAERFVGAVLNADGKAASAYARHALHMMQSVGDAGKFFLKTLKSGENFLDSATKLDNPTRAIAPETFGKTKNDGVLWHAVEALGKVINMPTRLLMSTDEFFKQVNYRASAKTQLYHGAITSGRKGAEIDEFVEAGMSKLVRDSGARFSEGAIAKEAALLADKEGLEGLQKFEFINKYVKDNYSDARSIIGEASDDALQFAQEATFTSELGENAIAGHLQNLVRAHPYLQVVVPFVRTPVNILTFFAQRVLPITEIAGVKIPVASSLHKRAVADLASGDPLRIAAVKGRIALGSTMLLTFAELAQQGMITGAGPRDENSRKALMETGWQPYSIRIGDTWVSYAKLDPISSFLGVASDLVEVANNNEKHSGSNAELAATMAVVALQNNVTNKSYLAGLSDLFRVITDPERNAPRVGRKMIANYLPNLTASLGGTFGNDEMREVRSITDALVNRVPILQQALEPRRNVLGEPVDARLAGGGAAFDWINPFVVSHNKNDKVMNELASLQHGFAPLSERLHRRFDLTQYHTAKGQTAYDRATELTGLVRVGGRTLRQALEQLISSSDYQKLPENETSGSYEDFSKFRVSKINSVIAKYRTVALDQMLKEVPVLQAEIKEYRKAASLASRGQQARTQRVDSEKPSGLLGLVQ